jgi:hypothetical protein
MAESANERPGDTGGGLPAGRGQILVVCLIGAIIVLIGLVALR